MKNVECIRTFGRKTGIEEKTWKTSSRMESEIKRDLKELGSESEDWFRMAPNRVSFGLFCIQWLTSGFYTSGEFFENVSMTTNS